MSSPPEDLARAHYADQKSLVQRIVELIKRLGPKLTFDDIRAWFAGPARLLQDALVEAQRIAAQQSAAYMTAAALALGITPHPAGALVPEAFAGTAADGRPLQTLLALPVLRGQRALEAGASERAVLEQVIAGLTMTMRTEIADAGRNAASVALTTDKALYGYVRLVQLPACARCIILSGRVYTWSDGFARHPNCDCIHIPLNGPGDGEKYADQHRERIVAAMDPTEQDRVFGKAGARAIRDGANINQVVNATRGMYVTKSGRKATSEGTTARGIAGRRLQGLVKVPGERYRRSFIPRLTPAEIYRLAGDDREAAIRALTKHGYI